MPINAQVFLPDLRRHLTDREQHPCAESLLHKKAHGLRIILNRYLLDNTQIAWYIDMCKIKHSSGRMEEWVLSRNDSDACAASAALLSVEELNELSDEELIVWARLRSADGMIPTVAR